MWLCDIVSGDHLAFRPPAEIGVKATSDAKSDSQVVG